MLRYEIDRLGWYEFEGLTQTLLKHFLGLGVEAWGGSGDWGRDAYFPDQLRYPTASSPGPFLFQCKFIDGANAAGANSRPGLRSAISAEAKRIPRNLPNWGVVPSHYALFTNAPVSGDDRLWIQSTIQVELPTTKVHTHDGQDICAWLDNASHIARTFPQILGLRDLEALLLQWINRDVYHRSQTAVADAHSLSTVFVPTEPYSKALAVIGQHHFVVLEGPPEMGKTAIARMIALTYLARGWEVIECRSPDDFLNAFSKERPQFFVADDFFGRTEYDTSRISKWQDDLPYVLKRLDGDHLLALTTRAHLLNLARRKIDISGYQGRFPDIGEVVVDASRLSTLDKARMLYRHCKAAVLPAPLRAIVREQAEEIVANPHFTPERIRRLVHDVLGATDASTRSKQRLTADIAQILADPTQAMSVSFDALPEAHKWMLFALLEADMSRYRIVHQPGKDRLDDLKKRFERLCPTVDRLPVPRVAEELTEAFVRHPDKQGGGAELDWVHPSVRDLAICQLSALPKYRKVFLRACGPEGLQLACSVGGGSKGEIAFPLLVDDDDWSLFADRIPHVIASIPQFIGVLASTIDTAKGQEKLERNVRRLRSILYDIALPAYLEKRGDPKKWTLDWVIEFLEAFEEDRQHPTFVDVVSLWSQEASKVDHDITRSSRPLQHVDDVIEVLKAGQLIVLRCQSVDTDGVGNLMQQLLTDMVECVSDQYDYLSHREEPMDLDEEIYALTDLIDHLTSMESTPELMDYVELSESIHSMRDLLDQMEELNQQRTLNADSSTPTRSTEEVPVSQLFADL